MPVFSIIEDDEYYVISKNLCYPLPSKNLNCSYFQECPSYVSNLLTIRTLNPAWKSSGSGPWFTYNRVVSSPVFSNSRRKPLYGQLPWRLREMGRDWEFWHVQTWNVASYGTSRRCPGYRMGTFPWEVSKSILLLLHMAQLA